MRQGKAYPCFETREELAEITARQKATGALPGYYGEWAIWRDAPEELLRQRLTAGEPCYIRFRSPGIGGHRGSLPPQSRRGVAPDENPHDRGRRASHAPRRGPAPPT